MNVIFNGLSSTDSNGTINNWSWSFGDQTANGSGSIVSHSYTSPGTYQVTLTITDTNSKTSTVTKSVIVSSNIPPTATFTFTSTALSVYFNAISSQDTDGSIVSYNWNFGDSQTGTGVSPFHTYSTAGTYDVVLTVTDNLGGTGTINNSISVSQSTSNNPPIAAFTQTTSSLTVSVNGISSTDSDGQVVSWSWNFGDGTSSQSGSIINHAFSNSGTYTITLTVTDNLGAIGTTSQNVTVNQVIANIPPVAAFTFTTNFLSINLDGTGSSDSDGQVVSWNWSFGDGST